MHIIQLTSLNQPDVEVYSTLTETQLRNKLHPEQGIFIAESPKVIRVALEAGFTPGSRVTPLHGACYVPCAVHSPVV